MKSKDSHNYAVIVAGGLGTRLWPISRQELPKQMQKLISDKTLIEETVDRLAGVVDYDHVFVSTTKNYAEKIRNMLPKIPHDNVIVEPVARGTTAAFALFAETIYSRDPHATIFSLASDHAVSETELFQDSMTAAYDFVTLNPKTIALVGIEPSKPDTGLGYIKIDQTLQEAPLVYSVEKFVEKPSQKVAERYYESGDYYWNSAYYCFKAKTLIDAYEEADPAIMSGIRKYIKTGEQSDFETVPIKPQEIEIINATKFPLALVAARFKWSDIGNWSALHDLLSEVEDESNMVVNSRTQHIDVDSTNCMVIVKDDKKIVATVGLNNIVIVDTEDALLVLDKDHTQDIKAVLESIKMRGLVDYL